MPDEGSAAQAAVEAVQPYLSLWSLRADGPPLLSATSVVQLAWRGASPVAVKLVRSEDEAGQRAALLAFAGRGAVRLLDWDGPALLIERVHPGTPLVELVRAGRDD